VLLARVEALLLRVRPPAEPRAEKLVAGRVAIDGKRRQATISGKEVDLTTADFDILWLLASRPGTVVTRDEILREVWNDPDMKTSKTLDMHMSWLRRKIGGERRIATVRGVGFRFNHN